MGPSRRDLGLPTLSALLFVALQAGCGQATAPITIIPERYRGLFAYNPLARMVETFRAPLMEGPTTTVAELAFVLAIGAVTAIVGWFVFHRYEDRFINYL